MKILDQYGTPLKPGTDYGAIAEHTAQWALKELLKPSKLTLIMNLIFLRKSCGVESEQKPIKFRRYS